MCINDMGEGTEASAPLETGKAILVWVRLRVTPKFSSGSEHEAVISVYSD